jgi:hypothetical protein
MKSVFMSPLISKKNGCEYSLSFVKLLSDKSFIPGYSLLIDKTLNKKSLVFPSEY